MSSGSKCSSTQAGPEPSCDQFPEHPESLPVILASHIVSSFGSPKASRVMEGGGIFWTAPLRAAAAVPALLWSAKEGMEQGSRWSRDWKWSVSGSWTSGSQ